ncbi:MAG: phosphodiester glycosidase family protein [Bacteroidetes bacterium]|nr:phosphodiester glycosidase family protein [Bacteroidota bacterium]
MIVKKLIPGMILIPGFLLAGEVNAQVVWQNVDSLYQPLPASVHVYKTTTPLDGKPNIAFYAEIDLKDPAIAVEADTTKNRRLTPAQFYTKNAQPLLVVNTTFFSFTTHQSLNMVIRNGKIVARSPDAIPLKGKDTLKYFHALSSAIGITRNGYADIGWVYAKRLGKKAWVSPFPVHWIDSASRFSRDSLDKYNIVINGHSDAGIALQRWRMHTAVGGGPVLMESGTVFIANNEERKFAGKAIDDKHPRTGIGYTSDRKLIILVIQGRFPGVAEGATLRQEAQLFKDIGCFEAMNLDGGGSSAMLINGKETIRPSDKEGQRAVPAVLLVSHRNQ